MSITIDKKNKKRLSYLFSALGALGVALQNYMAVEMTLRAMVSGLTSLPRYISGLIQAVAIGAGGLCSGMVNYFINVELLDGFLERITGDGPGVKLGGWRKFRYYAGIGVFAMTGVLFGLMAFTFSASGPLLFLGIAAGVFVAIIMTIQEIETWLQSFDNPESGEKESLIDIFKKWKATLTFGKFCGHVIAAGNVIALSLLFTLGLAEVLMLTGIAAFPAFIIGISVAFTFGAFTEFYFYNVFLSKFCSQFKANWEAMKSSKYASFGFACIGTNALVNAALTYSGVCMLSGALVLAGIGLPPIGLIMALAVISALFAGAASFVLGMDFWVRKQGTCVTTIDELPKELPVETTTPAVSTALPEVSHVTRGNSIFLKAEAQPAAFGARSSDVLSAAAA